MYNYNPLRRENREIRLVRLIFAPASTTDAQSRICLSITHASLDDGVPFLAMSYVWGDTKNTIDVDIDGELFPIGRNLHALLRQLRTDKVKSWIWVDSICIQQTNLDEKSWQVDQMRHVYTLAESVILWLGPCSEKSDPAMDFLARVGPKAIASGIAKQWTGSDLRRFDKETMAYLRAASLQTLDSGQAASKGSELQKFILELLQEEALRDSSNENALCRGFSDILQRINWHRVWIIQEVALAREALVLCGGKRVSLDALDATFTAIWCCLFSRPGQLHSDYRNFCQGLDSNLFTIKSLDVRRRRKNGENIRFVDIIFEVLTAPGRPHYSVTDHRDIVFGLLGVITDVKRLGIVADYSKSTAEVFATMTRALLYDDNESRIFKLDCCPPRAQVGSLPSWVPAWDEIGRYGTRFYRVNQRGTFGACGRMQAAQSTSSDERANPLLLQRRGCRADVVTEVMRVSEGVYEYQEWGICRIRDVKAWLRDICKFANIGPQSDIDEDALWRTVLFDRHDWYPSKGNHGLYPVTKSIAQLIRHIMKQESIDCSRLTSEQLDFIHNGPFRSDMNLLLRTTQEQVAYLARQWPRALGNMHRERVIFKTASGRLGVGHSIVQAGDVVVVLWGIGSPVILRPKAEGWCFVGDAYVDGIMYGEVLVGNPQYEEYNIY